MWQCSQCCRNDGVAESQIGLPTDAAPPYGGAVDEEMVAIIPRPKVAEEAATEGGQEVPDGELEAPQADPRKLQVIDRLLEDLPATMDMSQREVEDSRLDRGSADPGLPSGVSAQDIFSSGSNRSG